MGFASPGEGTNATRQSVPVILVYHTWSEGKRVVRKAKGRLACGQPVQFSDITAKK